MPGTNLTKAEAAERAALVSNAAFRIRFDFTGAGASETFDSSTTITFDAPEGARSFLDLVAEGVTSATLNGAPIDLDTAHSPGRLELVGLASHNTVTVDASFAYRHDGQGIHKFTDPEDGEVYLYSQFAANDARSAFPCFDQPDIKAGFDISVLAPAHWVVVSNSPVSNSPAAAADAAEAAEPAEPPASAARLWSFSPTVALPCYVAAVIAGPYAHVQGSLTGVNGSIPAAVYGRRNLAAHLDAEEMIATAQAGLELYERVFATPYPYEKYDQIFVPEYNLGAMENVGAVTFSEDRLLFRSRPSDALRQQRVNIVLHELSHMWFGNLVTMRWWDDLWLNESFAEFMGTWATERTSQWKDAWVTFGASRKSVAYVQDQLPTTHPIVAEIPDVEATVSAFDMITYAKGASALKQLVALVGEESFFAGVAAYLERYAFGNATLAEFLAEVEKAYGQPLGEWSTVWLETPGPSTLSPVIASADGKLTSLAIAQSVPAEFPVMRPHRISIAGHVFDPATASFSLGWHVEVTADGPLTQVPDATGLPKPDLLIINHDDLTYAKTQLDPASLATAAANIGHLHDAMTLAIVLDSMWHMCRDAAMPAERYVDAVLAAMPVMTNSETIESHMRSLAVALTRYVHPSRTVEVTATVAARLWSILEVAAPGSDLQLQALKGFARFATTAADAQLLESIRTGSREIPGVTIDADLAWELIAGVAAATGANDHEIDKQAAADAGAAGLRKAAGARAALGTIEAKREAWASLAAPDGGALANAVQYEVAQGLSRAVDPALLSPLATQLLDELTTYYAANEGFVGARVAKMVFPAWAAGRVPGLEQSIERWLADNEGAPSVLVKIVREGLDDVRRTLKAQATS